MIQSHLATPPPGGGYPPNLKPGACGAAPCSRTLKQSVTKAIDDAPRYPEGTGVRLVVKRMADLASIQKLAAIKLAN